MAINSTAVDFIQIYSVLHSDQICYATSRIWERNVKARTHGDQFGCTDTGMTNTSPECLSRVLDAMDLLREGFDPEVANKVFASLPTAVKVDFNYGNWRYVGPEHRHAR
jgi:hypothetical protein